MLKFIKVFFSVILGYALYLVSSFFVLLAVEGLISTNPILGRIIVPNEGVSISYIAPIIIAGLRLLPSWIVIALICRDDDDLVFYSGAITIGLVAITYIASAIIIGTGFLETAINVVVSVAASIYAIDFFKELFDR